MRSLIKVLFYGSAAAALVAAFYSRFGGELFVLNTTLLTILLTLLWGETALRFFFRYAGVWMLTKREKELELKVVGKMNSTEGGWIRFREVLSLIFLIPAASFLFYLGDEASLLAYPLTVAALDSVFYLIGSANGNWFRAGLNEQILIWNPGYLDIISFKDLVAVQPKYDELHFEYRSGRVKSVPFQLFTGDEQEAYLAFLRSMGEKKGFFVKTKKNQTSSEE